MAMPSPLIPPPIQPRLPGGIQKSHALSVLLALLGILSILLLLLLGLTANDSSTTTTLLLAAFLGVICVVPAVYSSYHHAGRLDLFHPLIYVCWIFFIPHFVIAPFLFLGTPPALPPRASLPDLYGALQGALELTIIASLGLSFGYFLPLVRRFGQSIPRPAALDQPSSVLKPVVVVFLILGFVGQLGVFASGLFGFHVLNDIPAFSGVAQNLVSLLNMALIIIFFSLFNKELQWKWLIIVGVMIMGLNVLTSASRSSLILQLLLIGCAYQYVQKTIRIRNLLLLFLIVVAVAVFNFWFGSTFRTIQVERYGRAADANLSVQQSIELGFEVIGSITTRPLTDTINASLDGLTQRSEDAVALAVIITHYPQHQQEEISLGINNNILRDLITSFVPRFLFTSRAPIGISADIGLLYYGYPNFSSSLTLQGDLYRNFGPWSIFPGMMLLGMTWRTIYVWLIERRKATPLAVGIYYVMMGFSGAFLSEYAIMFSAMFRNLIMCVIAILLTNFLLGIRKKNQQQEITRAAQSGYRAM